MTTFTDQRVASIHETFSAAEDHGLIHHYSESSQWNGRHIQVGGSELKNFVTCSYFGLELDERIKESIASAASNHGASFIVSRTYASSPLFAEFEERLEAIFESPVVVAPSTTLAHLSFISVMIQKGDVLILDGQVHNSVQLAASTAVGKAKVIPIRHNDTDRLRQVVERQLSKDETQNVWYFGDGIYSMYGDVAPVEELCQILDEFPRFHCYLDDAHGMSIRGKNGRGYVLSNLDAIHPKMVVAVSLSKCFGIGCGGALVFGNRHWRDMVQSCGATMIFSSPMPPPMLAAGIASAEIHLSAEIEQMQEELAEKISYFRKRAAELSIELLSSDISPVQYVMIGDYQKALEVARRVLNDGFFVSICAYPAVAINHTGLRLTISRYTANNDIDLVLRAIRVAIDEAVVSEILN